MLTIDLDSSRPYQGCNITLDLGQWCLAEGAELGVLGVTQTQLDVLKSQKLDPVIPGSFTTLYYHFGVVRVVDRVAVTAQAIRREKRACQVIALREEDSLYQLDTRHRTLADLTTLTPLGVITTVPVQHTIDQHSEVIQAHYVHRQGLRLLQYKYPRNDAFLLLQRLATLTEASPSSIHVGNIRLRSFL
jgi:hypothetical protein